MHKKTVIRDGTRLFLKDRTNFARILLLVVIAVVGVYLLTVGHAATSSSSVQAESGLRANGAGLLTVSSSSGGSAVQFKTPVVTPTYCGGRSFVAPAQCIGQSEWNTHKCTTLAQCTASSFKCYAYMNGDRRTIFNMTAFNHASRADSTVNPAICGNDIWPVITGTAVDGNGQVASQSVSGHLAVQNGTRKEFQPGNTSTIVTGDEYDPTKP